MQCSTTQPGPGDLARCLAAARSRPCIVCGTSPDGVLQRCAERFQDVERVLVIAHGARNELAFVPVFWDGERALGCVDLDELLLVRPPAPRRQLRGPGREGPDPCAFAE